MPITIPEIKVRHCLSFTACGDITTNDKKLVKWLKSQKRAVAPLGKSADKTYIRVAFGAHEGKHFHVDISQDDYFPRTAIPSAKVSLKEILDKIKNLVGQTIIVDLRGVFEIDIKELPETGIIKSLFFQTQSGNVSIKLQGSKLSLTGTPVNEITWQFTQDEKHIRILIDAEGLKTKISESYLNSAFSILEKGLDVFILGKINQ